MHGTKTGLFTVSITKLPEKTLEELIPQTEAEQKRLKQIADEEIELRNTPLIEEKKQRTMI